MQFRITTLSTAFRTVPRRLRMTLTKTPRTFHPSGGPHGFRRQLLRRAERMTRKRFRSENVVAESVSAQQVSTETEVVGKAAEEKVVIAKSTVANVAVKKVTVKTDSSAKTITAEQVDLGVSSKRF